MRTARSTTTSTTASTTTPAAPPSALPVGYQHSLRWTGSGRVVALTFDDGPGPYTTQVLDILQRYGVRATFCQIGEQVHYYPAIERRIAAAGHRLCDHSWDHDEHLSRRPASVIDSEIARTKQAIANATGITPTLYRAPGGDFGTAVLAACAREGTRPLGWSVDTRDWTRPGTAAIVAAALQLAGDGSIILLHDGGGDRSQTVAALPQIIERLRAAGYSFVLPPDGPSA